MVGIGGVGMAGVAQLLQARGVRVTGCDLHAGPLTAELETKGVGFAQGHAASHVERDVVGIVRTAATDSAHPEVREALTRGLPVWTRGEVLPALLDGTRSIAVAGTHGKTTTSSLIAQLLSSAGADPSWCIGGTVPSLGSVAGTGEGEWLVVEADESDGTLALYAPEVAVVTNIEFDHMEHFGDASEFEACFQRFGRQTTRRVVYCADDPRARALFVGHPLGLSYGTAADAAVRAVDAREDGAGLRFTVLQRGEVLGEVSLPFPGHHNMLNALAAITAALETGLPFEAVVNGVRALELPLRRFERVVDDGVCLVVSDYAHHPSEIRALIQMARAASPGRLRAVFQPHRYTRTLALGADFPDAFAGVDELVLLPVYAASEALLEGGTVWDLYRQFRVQAAATGTTAPNAAIPLPKLIESTEAAWAYFRATLEKGDTLLVIGAGDVDQVSIRAAEDYAGGWRAGSGAVQLPAHEGLTIRFHEALARKTTMRVGGTADIWAEVTDEAALTALVQWSRTHHLPLRMLGSGSNILVGDLGLRGVTARLCGQSFRDFSIDRNGVCAVGAMLPVVRLLDQMEAAGFGGLEFLEGIPGSIGGALIMNAGAWCQQVIERVVDVAILGVDGEEVILSASELGASYRDCRALRGELVLKARLRGTPDSPETIRQKRAAIAEKRAWMKGLRSAGSVFKNPTDDHAGRLIEASGLKGTQLGGARICTGHANLVHTVAGATSSDVRALIGLAHDAVLREYGVDLETEVKLWGFS